MRNKLVAANWKMNGDKALVSELLQGFVSAGLGKKAEVAVFAPDLFIPMAQELLAGSGIKLGGQNSSQHEKGAFTGETALSMLKEFGATHVLVGHSERRSMFGDTDQICALKVEAALAAGVTPVLCVGETLEQREQGITAQVVAEQIDAVIAQVGIEAFNSLVIAYEPVWAIGTGKTASPEQAQEVHAGIRSGLAAKNATVADKIQILYGGSVTAATASDLFTMADIDGGLVGGASLKLEEFKAICQAAE